MIIDRQGGCTMCRFSLSLAQLKCILSAIYVRDAQRMKSKVANVNLRLFHWAPPQSHPLVSMKSIRKIVSAHLFRLPSFEMLQFFMQMRKECPLLLVTLNVKHQKQNICGKASPWGEFLYFPNFFSWVQSITGQYSVKLLSKISPWSYYVLELYLVFKT